MRILPVGVCVAASQSRFPTDRMPIEALAKLQIPLADFRKLCILKAGPLNFMQFLIHAWLQTLELHKCT